MGAAKDPPLVLPLPTDERALALAQHVLAQPLNVNGESVDDLAEELAGQLAPHVTVLVMGSRYMKMERVVERIAVGFDADPHADAHADPHADAHAGGRH